MPSALWNLQVVSLCQLYQSPSAVSASEEAAYCLVVGRRVDWSTLAASHRSLDAHCMAEHNCSDHTEVCSITERKLIVHQLTDVLSDSAATWNTRIK